MKYYYFVFVAIAFVLYEYFTGVSNQSVLDKNKSLNENWNETYFNELQKVTLFPKLTTLGYSELTKTAIKEFKPTLSGTFENFIQETIRTNLSNVQQFKKVTYGIQ